MFQKILKTYAAKLYARLPKGGSGIVAAATGMDGQIKVLQNILKLFLTLLARDHISFTANIIADF